MMKVMVTGAGGFIGAYVCKRLNDINVPVVGLDNFNSYYDVNLKKERVRNVCPEVSIYTADVSDLSKLNDIFADEQPTHVIHLAAQAGVRYSLENPHAYVESNIVGFTNILEICRRQNIKHLIYASSSSVYGDSATPPFSEDQRIDKPRSFYAATKAANELMAYTYSQLYGINCTGLRFFTVYGPWGRPDMAPIIFSRAVLENKPIQVFNDGKMQRDFTYIEDIVDGVIAAANSSLTTSQSHRIFNLGNNTPIELEKFIEIIENAAGNKAVKQYKPMQPGDMVKTMASIEMAKSGLGFSPKKPIELGLPEVVAWCKSYYK